MEKEDIEMSIMFQDRCHIKQINDFALQAETADQTFAAIAS